MARCQSTTNGREARSGRSENTNEERKLNTIETLANHERPSGPFAVDRLSVSEGVDGALGVSSDAKDSPKRGVQSVDELANQLIAHDTRRCQGRTPAKRQSVGQDARVAFKEGGA